MKRIRLTILAAPLTLLACQSISDKDTIAKLGNRQIEIKEEKIEGGLDKAMQSYQRFLEEAGSSALAPEAIRRLADLKIEKEYGVLTESPDSADRSPAPTWAAQEKTAPPGFAPVGVPVATINKALAHVAPQRETEADFQRRATRSRQVTAATTEADELPRNAADLERAGPLEAVALYKKLLDKYPLYDRKDQVLYQMSRAYEELGRIKEAMGVMDRLVREFPGSRYIDEVQFRRAEYFFAHKHYLDAEGAYRTIVDIGVGSMYYELALYKLGWTFYKQELYEEALDKFIALLDYKVSIGYDFAQTEDETERKRMDDTFRVVSLSFSNLGGADSVVEYFTRRGPRTYEDGIYSNLAEFYFDKRRYADAATTYNAFVTRNPFHKAAPNFHMRVIEIHAAGGFPSLVLASKKAFATNYGLKSEYWKHMDPDSRPEILGFLKTNLRDLANHYHACYQDPRQAEDKRTNCEEALHWYREFLTSFPTDVESPIINYHLADLLLENKSFGEAGVEYEKTAYGYPAHENSAKAGYSAVCAYREQLASVAAEDKDMVKREVVRSSLKFADTFPEHEKAAIVLGAAADDLYVMKEYDQALNAANKLLEGFPDTDVDVGRAAWLVVGHSSYELLRYSEAEAAYMKVLDLLPDGDKTRDDLMDNLAASIYKQGEQADAVQDYRAAAGHFLRVSRLAPNSKIRPNAEFDGAMALIQLKDWDRAADVLKGFRNAYPQHPLQPEVTKKIAYVYRENGRLSLAAGEYERIEKESQDEEIRRESLLVAGELYEKDGDSIHALEVYRRYADFFPQPVEPNLEARNKITEILKVKDDRESYLEELRRIVAVDGSAGSARTPRTRYLAAKASLVLAQATFEKFVAVRLEQPFQPNLRNKRDLMKTATQEFGKLVDYEIAETTAAATFYLAEIYADFSKALMTSERPEGLDPQEKEQYELAIEDQAYPFEEKAIAIHESNLKLISRGVYNEWVDKSLQRLAKFLPARFDKPEEDSGIISSLETYVFEIERRTPSAPAKAEEKAPDGGAQQRDLKPAAEPKSIQESQPAEDKLDEKSVSAMTAKPLKSTQVETPHSVDEFDQAESNPAQGQGSTLEIEPTEQDQLEESVSLRAIRAMDQGQNEKPGSSQDTESATQEAEKSSSVSAGGTAQNRPD